ncbi:T9SS type A sorting domain-containing protein [Neolewinella persica]|uniref:T9SS type A sorting domain-containing protein n=1 Tax=Neolewinella persica TaxID=70998 RepID=UPI0003781C64|nr:T9SS type A sorting domain-containing protein [Neolewinella persica]
MKLFSNAALAVLFSFSAIISAQPLADLSIPDLVVNPVEDTMCVPINANHYQEVVAYQFAIRYDSTQLVFAEVRFNNNGLGINSRNFGMPLVGQLRHLYSPFDTGPITLPDSTLLFEVCFTPKVPNGYSIIAFGGDIETSFLDDDVQEIDSLFLTDGSLTFGEIPTIPLRPGDTNADGTVNHTDLLNIGLAYGASGPARDTVVDGFTEVEAVPWPQTLPDDTNFANIDADGNGTIEAADVAVLNTFYGQEAPGFWNPGGGTSSGRSADPSLYLGGVDTINAGELMTLPIFLGEPDNAAAGGNGLAFTLEFNPDEVDLSSLAINLENSFLGEDLLSIAKVTELTTGRFEVALARKDRADAPAPAGAALVGNLTFRALNNSANENYQLNLVLTPDAYLSADQVTIALGGTGNEIEVNGTVSSREPTWARGINIFPNPTQEGVVILNNLPAGVTDISLVTMHGQELARYPGSQRSLDLSELPAGMYVVRIAAGAEQANRLVVRGR